MGFINLIQRIIIESKTNVGTGFYCFWAILTSRNGIHLKSKEPLNDMNIWACLVNALHSVVFPFLRSPIHPTSDFRSSSKNLRSHFSNTARRISFRVSGISRLFGQGNFIRRGHQTFFNCKVTFKRGFRKRRPQGRDVEITSGSQVLPCPICGLNRRRFWSDICRSFTS